MKKFFVPVCCFLVFLTVTACGTDSYVEDAWRSTERFYQRNIRTAPEIDYDAQSFSSTEEKLARLLAPVDIEIDRLMEELRAIDRFPATPWQDMLFKEFPWINGLVVLTLEGQMLLRRPEAGIKEVNAELVLADQDYNDRRIHGLVDITPFGPEIYLATGMFDDKGLLGAIAVHFDMRTLMNFCPDPKDLVIIAHEGVLWDAGQPQKAAMVFAQPWEDLDDDSQGYFSVNERSYYFLLRYLGTRKLLYITTTLDDTGSAWYSFW